MIGQLIDMALASWEKVLTPEPKTDGLHAALAAMAEFQRLVEEIKNKVRLEFRL